MNQQHVVPLSLAVIVALMVVMHFTFRATLVIHPISFGSGGIYLFPALIALATYVGLQGSMRVKISFLVLASLFYLFFVFGVAALYRWTGWHSVNLTFTPTGWLDTGIDVVPTGNPLIIQLAAGTVIILTSRKQLKLEAPVWFGAVALIFGLILMRTVIEFDINEQLANYHIPLQLAGFALVAYAVFSTRAPPLRSALVILAVTTLLGLIAWTADSGFWTSVHAQQVGWLSGQWWSVHLFGWSKTLVIQISLTVLLLALLRDQLTVRRHSRGFTLVIAMVALSVLVTEAKLLFPLTQLLEHAVFDEVAFCELNRALNDFRAPVFDVCQPPEETEIISVIGRPTPLHLPTGLLSIGLSGLLIGLCAQRRWPVAAAVLIAILIAISTIDPVSWTGLWGQRPSLDYWPVLPILTYVSSVFISAPLGARLARWSSAGTPLQNAPAPA